MAQQETVAELTPRTHRGRECSLVPKGCPLGANEMDKFAYCQINLPTAKLDNLR